MPHLRTPYSVLRTLGAEGSQWFVLNFIPASPARSAGPEAEVIKFNTRNSTSLSCFFPTFVKYTTQNGKIIKKDAPLAFHYVFVNGPFEQVKKLCAAPNGFSFVIDASSSSRYSIVDPNTMENFRRFCLRYSNRVPFYSLEGTDLQEWDLVEVVDGDFPGLIGYYSPSPGRGNGRIVLRLTGNLGTVTYDINTRYIRILEFARNSKRVYDIIDAFVPRLREAMNLYREGKPLSETLIASLSTFCLRMGEARVDNQKIRAKLQALLAMSYTILGDPVAARARESLQRSLPAVTNPATLSLISQITELINKK